MHLEAPIQKGSPTFSSDLRMTTRLRLGPELEVVCPCEASDHNASDQTPCDQSPCGQTLRRGRLLQVRAPKSLCRERLFPKLPCTFHAPMRARRFFVVRYKLSDPHFHCNCFATKRVPFNTYFIFFFLSL